MKVFVVRMIGSPEHAVCKRLAQALEIIASNAMSGKQITLTERDIRDKEIKRFQKFTGFTKRSM